MTATPSIELPSWMAEQLSQASPDLLRQMVQIFAEALMSAEADAACGASYGQDSERHAAPATASQATDRGGAECWGFG
jgi:putative transposase